MGVKSRGHSGNHDSINLSNFPIDSLLRQAVSQDPEQIRTACTLFGSMCSSGRTEAGVFLLGLVRYYEADLQRLQHIVKMLAFFPAKGTVNALADELKRVKSSNTTRAYIGEIIKTLAFFPLPLIQEPLLELSEEKRFSRLMRRRFYDLATGREG